VEGNIGRVPTDMEGDALESYNEARARRTSFRVSLFLMFDDAGRSERKESV
jgi:hypothetical protein